MDAGEEPQPVAERLAGSRLLLTGATGFLGKAVLATWLRVVPDAGPVHVLVRASDQEAAHARLRDEILASPPFEVFERSTLDDVLESGGLVALPGDLTDDSFDELGIADIDVVIHCAASVSFEQPLDEIIELNVLGTLRLAAAVSACGPHFVHVSTAYAAGRRTGFVLERPFGHAPGEPAVELHTELDAARSWRAELDAESLRPEHQQSFVAEARHELGPAGELAVSAQGETLRHAWVARELVERGRERSRALGFADAYAFSKALTERALVARPPGPLSIVRPSIIESALRDPYPGWIEGLKVADPVILAYARGLVPRFPAQPSARLDIVPVDLVANACVAAAAFAPERSTPRTIAVASGARNPLRVSDIAREITAYFRDWPLPDTDGAPVEVSEWRLERRARVMGALDRGERALRSARRLLDRVPVPRGDDVERRLHRERRQLERLRRLAEIYAPYVELDCMFDDREAIALLHSLSAGDREQLPFDTAEIDWGDYLARVHLPAVRALVRQPIPARRLTAERPGRLPQGEAPALAFFDVEGVVLDTTVAHFYMWLRTRGMPYPDRALWPLTLARQAPGLLIAERHSRAQLLRSFYRNYSGLSADELRADATGALSEFILPRMQHDAVRRIRAHRSRGDRVVLITGALDFLVEPLAQLADEIVATRLVEERGAFTGELAEPPLTADGRASLAASRAADHGVALEHCYAYGDAISDLPLLEASGHPHAINPDFRLAREAHRRGWPVLTWKPEPGARTRPLVAAGA